MGDFLASLHELAATITIKPNWRYGKVYAVFAFDFNNEKQGKYINELNYLKKYYNNHLDLITEKESGHKLSSAELTDKVVIIGHADADRFYGAAYKKSSTEQHARKIVTQLRAFGLKKAGVIKLHACTMGRRDGLFMRLFYKELIQQNILFSYLSAPIGYYIYNPVLPRFVSNSPKGHFAKPMRGSKYTILTGNIKRDFKNTRYTIASASQLSWEESD